MAIAGGATVAYRCRVVDNVLVQANTTYPSSMCATVDDAIAALANGDTVIVSGHDKAELNRRLTAAGVSLRN